MDIPSLADWLKIDFANEWANPLNTGAKLYVGGEEVSELVIPEGTTEIGDFAFQGGQFTSMTIPNSVTNISPTAFAGCEKIESLVFCPMAVGREFVSESGRLGTSATLIWPALKLDDVENFRACFTGPSVTYPCFEDGIHLKRTPSGVSVQFQHFEDPYVKCVSVLFSQRDDGVCGYVQYRRYATGANRIGMDFDTESYTSSESGYAVEQLTAVLFGCSVKGLLPDSYGTVKQVTILDGTSELGGRLFQGCEALGSVSIPTSVTNIDATAFAGCGAIKEVEIAATNLWHEGDEPLNLATLFPDSVAGITDVAVDEGVLMLPDDFVEGCTSLETLALPASLEDFGDNDIRWFGEKVGKDGLWIENGWVLGYIGTAPENVVIPEGVKGIAGYAFEGQTGIETIEFPESLRYIGVGSFEGCVNLEGLELPEGLERIDDGAFKNCTWIQDVEFPSTLTRIGKSAFENCTSIYPGIVFNEGLKTIEESAFSNCWRMVSVAMPASVDEVGDGAFYDCRNLIGATIPTHVRPVAELFPSAYANLKSIVIAEGETNMTDGIFAGCAALPQIRILDTIPEISASAFYCCAALEKVLFDGEILAVGDDAFVGCSALQPPLLPETVRSIGARAFKGLSQFSEFKFPASLVTIGAEAFSGCSGISAVELPRGLETLGEKAFYGMTKLTAANIPATVTSLGTAAFGGCGAIRSVSMPGGLLTASSVFPNSYQIISSATVTDGSPEICADLFNGCWQLAQVDLPTSVTNIGANAFLNCSALTAVGIPGGVRKLGTAAFKGCSSITSLSLPQGLTSIADETFYGCSSLGELVIPGSVTSLGARVFSGCNAMTSVSYVGNAPSYVDSSYSGASAAMVSRVVLGTTGWDGVAGSKAIPEVWPVTNSRAIEYWDVITFDVSFYGNGGAPELAMVGQVTGLTYALPLEDPVRTGYAFAGWWTETANGAQVKATDKVAATRPHNLYAHWTPNEYTVAFHANGGLGTMESVTLQYDASATLTTCGFYKKNAEFAGWATEKDGPVVYADGAEVKNLSAEANALVTLYAVWTERIWSAADYLGCPGRPFVDSGDAPWVPDEEMFCSAPGSMRSGAIEAAEEFGRTESVLSTTVLGEGSGSFWWKVDCEPEDGGEYYDYALFEIDGVEVAKIAGHVNWTEVRFEVTGAGEHTLRWTFTRDDWDEDPSLYENAAWLDDFVFAPTPVMVAFDGNGATAGEVPSAIVSSAGESVTLPDAGTLRNGAMLFEGWLDSDRGETYRGGDAYVVGVTNVTLKAVWSEHVWTLAEILGADNLTFTADEGDAAWFGDFANTHDGKVALRSGAIGDSQESRVTAMFSGDGELAFWTRTDGEFNRGKMVDYLKVELDGELVFSGATNDWTRVVVPVSGLGEHTVVWTYLKNGSKSVGLDRAWLSEVVWTPASVYPITYENLMGATNANPSVYHVGDAFDFAAPGPVVGYTFTGWSPTSITDETKGAVTVTASWRANAYRIVYDANGGTGETSPSACVYDGPEVRVASCGFVRTDYNFLGWATTSAGDVVYSPGDVVPNLDVADGAEIVFYAVWQPKYVYEDLTDETVAFVKMNDSVSTSYEVPSEFSGKTVVAIAAGAFAGDTALVEVVLPPTVTEIGEGAFAGCTSLKTVCISGSGEIARLKALLESSGLDTSGITFTEKTLRLANPVAVVNTNGVEAVVSVSVTAVYVPDARLVLTLNGVEVKSWTGLSTGVYSEDVSVVCGSTNVFEFVATEGGLSDSAKGTFVARTYVGWFDVRFEDEGFVEGEDWLARSVDRSGGHFIDDLDSFELVKGERSYLYGSDGGRLQYVPSAPSETNAPVTVSGSAYVKYFEVLPEVEDGVQASIVFADGNVYVASVDGWMPLDGDGLVAGEWVDYEVRLDYSDNDAPRVQYVVGSNTSAWMRTACNGRSVTSLDFYAASVGDFKASYMSSQAGGEVVELVAPEFTSDGSAIGHSGTPGTAGAVFSMTIANPIAGAYYTVYTAEHLSDVFIAESDSTLFQLGDAVLTLVMSADTPSKFARIVVSRTPVKQGAPLK